MIRRKLEFPFAEIRIALAVFVAISPHPLPAQEETGGALVGPQELVDLIREACGGEETPPPSVLEGIDLRRAPAEMKKIARTLRETKVDISFERQSAADIVKLLRELSGLNFAISPKAKASLDQEKPEVTLSLKGLPLENILNLLAVHLGEYRFTIRYGLIFLIRNEEHRPAKVRRIYDVTDLVRPRPDFPAPKLALSAGDEKR